MNATMKDVAKEANVSIATVSRAISGNGYISNETLDIVLKACKTVGFQIRGKQRKKSQTSIIGAVASELKNVFDLQLINGITETAKKKNYDVIIFDQQEDAKRSLDVVDIVSSLSLCGIILIPVKDTISLGFEYLSGLEKLKIPIVLLDRDIECSHFDGVFIDNIQGSFNAVQSLVRAGHQKIAFISGPVSNLTGRDRKAGFIKAMKEYNIHVHSIYMKEGNFTFEGGYRSINELLDLNDPPTAVFVANSTMTKGVYQALCERKLKIPEDIAMISFDKLVEHSNLSAVEQPVKEMGAKAAEMLIDRLSEPSYLRKTTVRLILNPTLSLRGSEQLVSSK